MAKTVIDDPIETEDLKRLEEAGDLLEFSIKFGTAFSENRKISKAKFRSRLEQEGTRLKDSWIGMLFLHLAEHEDVDRKKAADPAAFDAEIVDLDTAKIEHYSGCICIVNDLACKCYRDGEWAIDYCGPCGPLPGH